LAEIKRHGNKPWDIIGLTIDYPPTVDHPFSSSIGVLRKIDFVSVRPKFIMIRIASSAHQQNEINCNEGHDTKRHRVNDHHKFKIRNIGIKQSIESDAEEALNILRRNGYQAYAELYDMTVNSVYVWGTRMNTIEMKVLKGLSDAEKENEMYWRQKRGNHP
jgi:hypothetical protein